MRLAIKHGCVTRRSAFSEYGLPPAFGAHGASSRHGARACMRDARYMRQGASNASGAVSELGLRACNGHYPPYKLLSDGTSPLRGSRSEPEFDLRLGRRHMAAAKWRTRSATPTR